MIVLKLRRKWPYPQKYTEGTLYISGTYFCDTLEPQERGLSVKMSVADLQARKIKGVTAIPKGVYQVVLSQSAKFSERPFYKSLGGFLPLLVAVPAFSGILIHCGNTSSDTSGCILVGKRVGAGIIGESRLVFRSLLDKLMSAAERDEPIFIDVS